MPTDAELRDYILGEAPDDAAQGIESAYFKSAEMLESVAEAERDLIEDYLSGRLAPETRARFETGYLTSPLHRQRVAIARALRARSAAAPQARRWTPWALAAALAIGLVGVVWRLQMATGGPAPIIAITLPAVAVRGEGATPTATVTDEAATVELRLERAAGGPCAAPAIAVRTVDGVEIWRGPADGGSGGGGSGGGSGGGGSGDASGSPGVTMTRVPARQLPDGDYIVLLLCGSSTEPLQRSAFRVVRR